MPGYLLEKLGQARSRGKSLYLRDPGPHPLGLKMQWEQFIRAIESARDHVNYQIMPLINALNEIRKCIDEGGEPAFTVKRIRHILDSTKPKKIS